MGRRHATAAVVLLVVAAGCAGLGGSGGDGARTVADRLEGTPTRTTPATAATPATGTSPTDAPLPPGVTPDAADEVDERALSVAHYRALRNRSVTMREQQVVTAANGTVLGWYTVTARTNGSRQRYELANGGANPDAVGMVEWENAYWTNGSATVRRQTLANGSAETTVRDGGPASAFGTAESVRSGRFAVETTLSGTELAYVGAEARNGTPLHLLAGTADDSRLTLRVTPDGVVRSFVYRTDARTNGTRVTVLRRFRVSDVGTTTVGRPAWAANATPG